jgi:hypothetical protein
LVGKANKKFACTLYTGQHPQRREFLKERTILAKGAKAVVLNSPFLGCYPTHKIITT